MTREIIVAGFALFAMFFGAGNLIFPPALGLMAGDEWFGAFLGFFAMDAGLAILGVFAMLRFHGDLKLFSGRLGRKAGTAFSVIMVLCIGPFIAIPRTGAVTFSMAVQPLFGWQEDDPVALFLFSVLFFAVVFVLSVKPGKVVDIIGKYMTPVLLAFLLFMIVVGLTKGTMLQAEALTESPVREGVSNGYQTLDGIAALLFSGVMIQSAMERKNRTPEQCSRMVVCGGVFAGLLLFLIYLGLTAIGRVWGPALDTTADVSSLDQAQLLIAIVKQILGNGGVCVIAVIAFFACLTTAIGLTSSCAEFFAGLTHGRFSCKAWCAVICVLSMILCNTGLSQIIAVAAPVLNLLYPPIVTMIVFSLFPSSVKDRLTVMLAAGTALAVSTCNLLCDTFALQAFSWVHMLPLDALGLNFAVPAVAAAAIGTAAGAVRSRKK